MRAFVKHFLGKNTKLCLINNCSWRKDIRKRSRFM